MIHITKSASEAPKLFSNAWKGIKEIGKSVGQVFGQAGANVGRGVATAFGAKDKNTKDALANNSVMSSYDESTARDMNKEYSLLSDAEKKLYLDNHLPSSIHSEARQFLINELKSITLPFTSDLYKLVIDYLPKGMNLESAQIISKNSRLFNKIFKDHGTKGIRLDSSAFQLKAIKYFFQKGADLTVLKKGYNWRSTQDMKHAIDNMSEDDKTKLSKKESSKLTTSTEDSEKLKKLKDFFDRMPDNSITQKYSKYSDRELLKFFDEIVQIADFIGEKIE